MRFPLIQSLSTNIFIIWISHLGVFLTSVAPHPLPNMLSRSFQQSFSWLLGCTCRIESIRGDGAAAGNVTSEASFYFPGQNCSLFFPSSVPGNPTLPPPLGIYRTHTTLWSYLCDLTCSLLSAPPIQIFSHVVRGGQARQENARLA